jgi:hypothetical protein
MKQVRSLHMATKKSGQTHVLYIFFYHKTLQKENSWARSIIFRHIQNVAVLLFFVHNIVPVHSTVHIPVYAMHILYAYYACSKEGRKYVYFYLCIFILFI